MNDDHYDGREQSQVKHLILRQYLQRFAQIIGQYWDSITYVDCFAGPWQAKSELLEDTSFGIAVTELRAARDALQQRFKRNVRVRAFFIEEDRSAFEKLRVYANQQSDMDIVTANLKLEDAVDDILDFVKQDPNTFPFVLIDPKGWSGFDIDVIRPLLELRPGEVLVNFMIEHIRRFVESEVTEIKSSFERLFGSDEFRTRIAGLPAVERDDAIAATYLDLLKDTGGYDYGSMAVVLHPDLNRRFFYLSYVTRNIKGIEVFKGAEKNSMGKMETLRARATQKSRVSRTKQKELFDDDEGPDSRYYQDLRESYLTRARGELLALLNLQGRVLYDFAWSMVMRWPMVWDSDIKDWIADWVASGVLKEIEGLVSGMRVPKLKSAHYLCVNDAINEK